MSWNITEETDQPNYLWFDWVNAVDSADNGFLTLYTNGCQVGNNQWNCTQACLDVDQGPKLVFNSTGSTYTLQNCMVLPVIAHLLATNNLTPYAVGLANKYNILPKANQFTNMNTGWPVLINNCVSSFCEYNNDSTPNVPFCNVQRLRNSTWDIVVTPSEDYSYQYASAAFYPINITFPSAFISADLCDNLDATINPDIGGIGMFVSYLMQMFIVLSAWLLFHLYQTWAVWPLRLTLLPFHGPKRASTIAERLQNAIKASHHTAALVSALAEFQKAQVFFMLAVQIAAIIALHNPSYIQATSWQQLWNNLGILYDLAFGGCLPVLFGVLILRLAGKKSMYMDIVTVCSVAVSGVTWFLTWDINPNPDTSISYSGAELPACGGQIAPIKYCYEAAWFNNNSDATWSAIYYLVFCFVVQVCLILDLFEVFRLPESISNKPYGTCFEWLELRIQQFRFWDRYEDFTAAPRRRRWLVLLSLDTRHSVMRLVHSIVLFGTECTFVALNIILIMDYAHLLLPNSFQTLNLKAWTLGQVIAVTIWVPVLLEYVWMAFAGPEEGLQHRLHPAYEVVRKGTREKGVVEEVMVGDDGVEIAVKTKEPSSSVELPQLPPLGHRPGYERVASDLHLME